MYLCHICSNFDKFYIDLMEEQISKGLDIRVFYFRAKQRGMPDVKAPYLDIRLNYSNWHRPFFYIKEKKIFKDFYELYNNKNFNILHAHTLFSNGYIALKAKKYLQIPYIVAVRDMDVNVFLKYRFYLRGLGMEILKEAEKIIFISKSYKDLVISKYVPHKMKKEFRKKSVVIPNGINSYYLDNKYYRPPLNVERAINIITVGYISKRKNQLTVCEAVKMLNESGIKAYYTVIGKVLNNKIFVKLKKYSFINYIPFLSKEKLINEYRKADIYVMPSITETFGLTYVEAMSQGLPVIYSKGQGVDGYFNEGDIGYHVNSLNPENIKNKIIDIINNYGEMSKNCLELADRFNWSDIVSEYFNIYTQICDT